MLDSVGNQFDITRDFCKVTTMRAYYMAMLDAAYVFSIEPIARLHEGRASLGNSRVQVHARPFAAEG